MESGSVPVEARINAIIDYEVRKVSKSEIARKYGVGESTVRGWMHTRDYFVNKCLEIAKIASEGKLNYFLGEEAMEEKEEQQGKEYHYYTEKIVPEHYKEDEWGKMYYTSPTGSSNGGRGNTTYGAMKAGGGARGYTEYELPMMMRDEREGKSHMSRKMYMESKEMHKDKVYQIQELEKYM